jgi:hypothetical protein
MTEFVILVVLFGLPDFCVCRLVAPSTPVRRNFFFLPAFFLKKKKKKKRYAFPARNKVQSLLGVLRVGELLFFIEIDVFLVERKTQETFLPEARFN